MVLNRHSEGARRFSLHHVTSRLEQACCLNGLVFLLKLQRVLRVRVPGEIKFLLHEHREAVGVPGLLINLLLLVSQRGI